MHEVSVAEALLALASGRLQPGQRLGRVGIDVGELASIEPDQLRFAWDVVTAGTAHAGAELRIAWHAAQQCCARCGAVPERQPGSWLRLCPHCASPLRIEGGDQLDLVDVDAAGDDATVPDPFPAELP